MCGCSLEVKALVCKRQQRREKGVGGGEAAGMCACVLWAYLGVESGEERKGGGDECWCRRGA